MNLKAIYQLLKTTFDEWNDASAPRLGAALAYYTVFSLAPLLLLVIAIAGLFLGEKAARGQIVEEIGDTVGGPVAESIQQMLEHAHSPTSGGIATAVAIVTLLFGASGVFGQLQDALNTIWQVKPKPGRGILGILRDRFLSMTMVLGTGFLLLVSLVVTAAIAALGKFLTPTALPGGTYLWQGVNLLVSLGLITLLFAMIFKVLPDVKIEWRDVWIGAVITAVLFTVGKFLLGYYLGRGSVTSAYGAAGSLVVLLIWVYYSSQILLFGAAFTRVYATRFGSGVRPAPNAVPVTEEARAEQGMTRDGNGKAPERNGSQHANEPAHQS